MDSCFKTHQRPYQCICGCDIKVGVWISLIFSTISAIYQWIAFFGPASEFLFLISAILQTTFAVCCLLALMKEQEQQWRTILFYMSLIDLIALVVIALITIIAYGFFLGTIIVSGIVLAFDMFWTYMFYFWMKELNENWRWTKKPSTSSRQKPRQKIFILTKSYTFEKEKENKQSLFT